MVFVTQTQISISQYLNTFITPINPTNNIRRKGVLINVTVFYYYRSINLGLSKIKNCLVKIKLANNSGVINDLFKLLFEYKDFRER